MTPLAEVLRAAGLPAGPLDVAVFWAGTGELVLEVARALPSAHVVGLDSSGRNIASARRLLAAHGLSERTVLARVDPLHAVHARYPLVVVARPVSHATDPVGAIAAGAHATSSRGACVIVEPSLSSERLAQLTDRALRPVAGSARAAFSIETQRRGVLLARALDNA